MPYTCLNEGLHLNVRADPRAKRRAAEKVGAGQRWEFKSGMYGNYYEVVDHELFRWYRQDRPVSGQIDLFDGSLPFKCDYCHEVVSDISPVHYHSIYWYYTRPNLPNAMWKRNVVDVVFSCCARCRYGPLPVPNSLVGYHMTELYQDGRLIYR